MTLSPYADKILENDPERYPLILTKAQALIRLGEQPAGKALLERIIEEDEGSVQYNLALMELDELLAAKDRKEPAIDPEEEEKTKGEEDGGKQDLPPVASVQDPLLVEQYIKTLNSIRYAVTAIQVYELDDMKLPGKLVDLVPEFIAEEQLMDAWGNPFHYKIDTRNNTFWLASGGSDGRFQGFDQKGTFFDLDGQDIISYDNDLVFQPDFR